MDCLFTVFYMATRIKGKPHRVYKRPVGQLQGGVIVLQSGRGVRLDG